MSRIHADILDDESDRGLGRVKKYSRGEDDRLVTFLVGEGLEDFFSSLSSLIPMSATRANPALLSK